MAVLAYGLNYRTAPIEVRERIAFTADGLPSALIELQQGVSSLREAAIVSTCNRTELYCVLDAADELAVPAWLASQRDLTSSELSSITYSHWDQDAARHMIRVASGLDSQVLGEPQILGQVKEALATARTAGTMGPELNLLSQITLNTAKRVRTETGIGRNPVSVAFAAVNLARQIFTDLSTKRALLLGAGDTISRVAEHLHQQGIANMAIANRTLANAQTLAARFGAHAMQLTDVAAELANYDIVIGSTGSSLPVLGKGAVEAAIRQRRRKPMFMVDIAVPRDIEPEVNELPDVYLYTLDDLTDQIDENLQQRRVAAEAAEQLVSDGAQHYLRERRTHEDRELLQAFRASADATQQEELAKALKKLQAGADAETVLAAFSQSLTNKLIHAPTVGIRKASADGRTDLTDLIKTLYQI